MFAMIGVTFIILEHIVVDLLSISISWPLLQNALTVILGDFAHRAPIPLMDICADLPVIVYNVYVTISMDVQVCYIFIWSKKIMQICETDFFLKILFDQNQAVYLKKKILALCCCKDIHVFQYVCLSVVCFWYSLSKEWLMFDTKCNNEKEC